MKLVLTTWQRIMLILILGNLQGDVKLIRKASKALDILELTEEEKKEVGLREEPSGLATWKDTERTFELEIADKEAAGLVKQAFVGYRNWPVAQRAQVEELAKQLGVEEEDEGNAKGAVPEDSSTAQPKV